MRKIAHTEYKAFLPKKYGLLVFLENTHCSLLGVLYRSENLEELFVEWCNLLQHVSGDEN